MVETPLPPFEEREVAEADRGATLSDLDYVIAEHLEAFKTAMANSRFVDVAACVAHLEGAATAAIKKSDLLIARMERQQNEASAPAQSGEPINVAELLELLALAESACPTCGGLRDE